MMLRRSQFVHVVELGDGQTLVLHALTHLRLGIDSEVARIIAWFAQPRQLPEEIPDLMAEVGYDRPMLGGCVGSLLDRGVLTQATLEEELAQTVAQLAETNGRDPGEMLEKFRRSGREGGEAYWAVSAPRGVAELAGPGRRLDVVLLGDCDLQTELDFLTREGQRRGLDLRVAATFPDDVRFAAEHRHDLIIVGALRSREAIASADEAEPFRLYVAEARLVLDQIRQRSTAPILIDNLPEPTLQPLGFADRGPNSHRNRFRRANLALAALTEEFADVHVVDVAATLAAAGAETLLDDGLTSFTPFRVAGLDAAAAVERGGGGSRPVSRHGAARGHGRRRPLPPRTGRRPRPCRCAGERARRIAKKNA